MDLTSSHEAEASTPEARSLDVPVACLIAAATLLGALFAWRSSVAGDAAGDADYAGLRAALNVEETRATNAVNAYEHYAAFTSFDRHDELARLIEDGAGPARDLEEARELASASRGLYPAHFVNRDGTYALERELGVMWADAAREKDLSPEPQFAEADRQRGKSLGLLIAVTLTAVALVFFTLVGALGARLQYLNLALGVLCLLVGGVVGTYQAWLVG